MQALLGIALLLLLEPVSCEDTEASNISGSIMYQISKVLSPAECHSFYTKINAQEEDEVLKLEQLSEEQTPIHSRKRRAITNSEQCKTTLNHWVDSQGGSVYWNPLEEALQGIGRTDVSLEQLNLDSEKDMEEYNKMAKKQEEELPEHKSSDPENSEQSKEPKTSFCNSIYSQIATFVMWFVWDMVKTFLLNVLALFFFYTYLRRRF